MSKLLGIDIGESSVKLVCFQNKKLTKAVSVPMTADIVSDGKILSASAVADILRNTAKMNKIPLVHSAVVLNADDSFVRTVTMPLMNKKQFLYNLPFEFNDFLTEGKENYFFDHSFRRIIENEEGAPEKMELLACATHKTTVAGYRAMLRRARMRAKVLVPAESSFGALIGAHIAKEDEQPKDRCIVDLGSRTTNIYIFHGEDFDTSRTVDLGMAEFERIMAEKLRSDKASICEEIKKGEKEVVCSDRAFDFYTRLAGDIVRAVNFYNYSNRERELSEIYLCGGGAGIVQLCNTIKETTRLGVLSAEELLPEEYRPETEAWRYIRAISGVLECYRGGEK